MKTSVKMLAALLFSVGAIQSNAQVAAVPAAEPVILADATVGETNALIAAINKTRTDMGLAALVVDPALTARADAAFPGLASAPGEVDVTALRSNFRTKNVGILRGVVTHRGVKSGGEFPKYWAQDARWNAVMIGDFNRIGAATAKRSDGKLIAFVYLIKK